jgi:large subunit ribosomal protein L3
MTVRSLIGKKIGTTQFFADKGEAVCVTAVEVGPCVVTQVKTSDNDGYDGVQLGFEEIKSLNKPRSGHLESAGGLYRHLQEVEVDDVSDLEVGQKLDVNMFEPGDRIDAVGLSKGRGFAGGVKRHHFAGGPKTHGQSDRHRAPGSIGAGTSPGRVIKGLKMAGHMGNARVTVRNLQVIQTDLDRNLILVKGSVPGAHNSLVFIRKSVWRRVRSQ